MGTLEEQSRMVEPWTWDDVGQYKVQLVDGNHRAAAAMILGLDKILVTVGENFRENVDPRYWVKWHG
jgi:ParB-like chromosome segregation protein Spo0J